MDWFDRWLDWNDAHPKVMQIVVLILAAVTFYEIWSTIRG